MSRDLTCKETMLPALDDGESLSDVRRLVSSNIFGRINSESLNQNSSSGPVGAGQPSFAAQINLLSGGGAGSRNITGVPPGINHTTTVRDVVSSRMKHGKATGEALIFSVNQVNSTPYWIKSSGPSNSSVISDTANANFIQSIIHETNRSLSSVQSQGGYPATKYVVNNIPSTSIIHQYPSTSQQSLKSRAPTIGIASVHNRGLVPASASQMVVNASYMGSNGNTIVYGPLPTRVDSPNKSKARCTTPLSGSNLLANRASPYPSDMTMSVGSVVRAAAANFSPTKAVSLGIAGGSTASPRNAPSSYAVVMPTHSRTDVIREGAGGGTASPQPGCTTPTNSQGAPNSHSSPRPTPSILRGSSAVRRFADKEAPSPGPIQSTGPDNNINPTSFSTTIAVNFSAHAEAAANNHSLGNIQQQGTSSNVGPSSSSGDENSCSRQDDSPRKRQRKQQFDNSQQDKLMMEVRPDHRFDQLSTENPTTWKMGDGPLPGSSTQLSTLKMSGYQSSGELNTGMTLSSSIDHGVRNKPRRRGRPRSINNRLDLPSSSFSPTPTTSHMCSSQTSSQTPMTNLSQVQSQASVPAAAANSLLASRSSSWVDVDSMLQVDSGNKRPRKYKKRAPEVNPETGEPIKKERKKGSGRKSKKDLLNMELIPTSNNVYSSFDNSSPRVSMLQFAAAIHNQQLQVQQNTPANLSETVQKEIKQPQNVSVSIFSQLGLDERGVVSTLCKFKSHRGTPTMPSTGLEADKKMEKEPSLLCSVMEAEDEEGELTPTPKIDDSKRNVKLPASQLSTALDPRMFGELRSLWKFCDRGENSLVNCYDELSTFIETCKPVSRHPLRKPVAVNRTASKPYSRSGELRCEVFENFEEFKNAQECLRLLPVACSYFHNSNKLLNSLRSNLLASALFQQANSYLSTSTPQKVKVDPDSVRPISELKILSSTESNQKVCKQFFKHIENMFPNTELNSNLLETEKELLLQMDVSTAIENLVDSVECETIGLPSTSSSNHYETQYNLCNDASAEVNCSPLNLGSLLRKLPQSLHSMLSSSSLKVGSGSRKLGRRKYESLSLPSNESLKVCANLHHQQKDSAEDGVSKKVTDKKRADVLLQILRENNENSQRRYKSLKKLAVKLLSKLEPARYHEVFFDANCRSKPDLETSFLMDLPKYRATFKSMHTYNPTKSITLRPTKQLVNKLFKGRHPYCKQSQSASNAVCTSDNSSAKLKSAAVDRMREKEANYMVLEELNEMEENTNHIAQFSKDRLSRRYSCHQAEFFSNISAKIGSFGGSSDTLSEIKDCANIDRSLKRTVPLSSSAELQLQYIQERCQETHEIMATALGLAHSRSNLARQSLNALMEIVQVKGSNADPLAEAEVILTTTANNDDEEETGSYAGSVLDANDQDSNPNSSEEDEMGLARTNNNGAIKKRKWGTLATGRKAILNKGMKAASTEELNVPVRKKFAKRTTVKSGA